MLMTMILSGLHWAWAVLCAEWQWETVLPTTPCSSFHCGQISCILNSCLVQTAPTWTSSDTCARASCTEIASPIRLRMKAGQQQLKASAVRTFGQRLPVAA